FAALSPCPFLQKGVAPQQLLEAALVGGGALCGILRAGQARPRRGRRPHLVRIGAGHRAVAELTHAPFVRPAVDVARLGACAAEQAGDQYQGSHVSAGESSSRSQGYQQVPSSAGRVSQLGPAGGGTSDLTCRRLIRTIRRSHLSWPHRPRRSRLKAPTRAESVTPATRYLALGGSHPQHTWFAPSTCSAERL